MRIEFRGNPVERQNGKTTIALRECRDAGKSDRMSAIYIAPTTTMLRVIPKLLDDASEPKNFIATTPLDLENHTRGVRVRIAYIDGYDRLCDMNKILQRLVVMGVETLVLIHSGI